MVPAGLCACRHNQELQQEQIRLEQEAEGLAKRLDAVLQNKFAGSHFDTETPIDKTLNFLQNVIKVRSTGAVATCH